MPNATHANAALTPLKRRELARRVLEQGWTQSETAKWYLVSVKTVQKWVNRYRDEGPAGMRDRSSRPHTHPNQTSPDLVEQILTIRLRERLGPVQIGGHLNMAASTVHAVLRRHHLHRLSTIDRASGEPIRRYEHPHPGSMIHVDVTKFANIPDGGGFPFVGREQGEKNRVSTAQRTRAYTRRGRPRLGNAFVHTVIDDHSRLAYAEICTDETATTAAAVLRRAVAWFAEHHVTVESVLSDNGGCYRSHHWANTCTELGLTHRRTRPYRPQTNGKIERFHRTLADGWARKRLYTSTEERNNALPTWLHYYNHHRPHSAIGGQPPITRLNNLPGHHK